MCSLKGFQFLNVFLKGFPVFKCVLGRFSSTNGTISRSHMMWCWCSFPSSWLGGRLGSLILEWWALSKHHCCIIRKKILTLTTHHRFPWKPKPKRSGERRHSDQIILRTRGRRYLQEVARGACWPGFRFHSITEKSPHSKPTNHHQTSTGHNSDSMCSNIF